FALLSVPQPYSALPLFPSPAGGRSEPGAVGGDCQTGYTVGVAGQGGAAFAGVGVPDPYRAILGRGGEPVAVGGDGQAGDGVDVAGQDAAQGWVRSVGQGAAVLQVAAGEVGLERACDGGQVGVVA